MLKLISFCVVALVLAPHHTEAAERGKLQIVPGKVLQSEVRSFFDRIGKADVVAYFKISVTETRCSREPTDGDGFSALHWVFVCEEVTQVCPTKITMTIPGSTVQQDFPVECTGPDSNGDCDCEFKEG